MRRLVFSLVALSFLVMVSAYLWLTMTKDGLHWAAKLTLSPYSNIINYDDISGTLSGAITIQNLKIHTNGTEITIDNGTFRINLLHLLLGTVFIPSVEVDHLSIIYQPESRPASLDVASSKSNLVLPIVVTINKLSISHLAIHNSNSNIPSFSNIVVTHLLISDHIGFNSFTTDSPYGNFSATGNFPLTHSPTVNIEVNGVFHANWLKKPVKVFIKTSGSYDALKVSGNIESPDKVDLRGTISHLSEKPRWKISLETESLKSNNWYKNSGINFIKTRLASTGTLESYSLSGTGTLNNTDSGTVNFNISAEQANKVWTIDHLQLTNAEKKIKLNLHGSVQTDYIFDKNTSLKLQGNWTNLAWPITSDAPTFFSHAGSVDLNGNISHYLLDLSGDLNAANQIISNINISGAGNQEHIDVTTLKCLYIGGSWDGSGMFDWQDGWTWNTTVSVNNVDASHFVNKLKTKLSSKLHHSGSYIDHRLKLDINIRNLSGSILKHNIKGYGNVHYSDNKLVLNNINLSESNNRMSGNFQFDLANTSSFPLSKAEWNFKGNDLSHLYPGLKGSMSATGKYHGQIENPILSATLKAKNISYADYSAKNIEADINLNKNNKNSHFTATAKNLSFSDNLLSSVTAKFSGEYENHNFNINLLNDNKQSINIGGRASLAENWWNAHVTNIAIENSILGTWTLADKTEARFSKAGFTVSRTCLKGVGTKDIICFKSDAVSYDTVSAYIDIKSLKLNRFKYMFPDTINNVSGLMNGNIDFQLKNNRITKLNLSLNSPAGNIDAISGVNEKQTISYENLAINAVNTQNNFVFNTSVNITDAGNIYSKIVLPNANQQGHSWKNQTISGTLDIQLDSLKDVSIILPFIENASGTWTSHFEVAGTLTNPLLKGESIIQVSSVSLPGAGIELKNLNLTTKTAENRSLILSGTASSGEGKISVTGTLNDYRPGYLSGNFTINGDHFRAANLPETAVIVSPSLVFTMSEKMANLEGSITIDQADIKILSQITSLTPSPDVVIVTEKPQEQFIPKLDFKGNVRVNLGDKVWLRGYGFEGRLQGSIIVHEAPGELTKATGDINIIDGHYGAYGQNLQIDSGKLSFTGSAIDNPAVNIRAIRKTSNDVIAGIQVTGQAQSPVIKLFSEPPMDDADVLAYIILGYPLKQASEQDGALLTRAAGSIGLIGGEKLVKRFAQRFGIDEVKVQSSNTTQEASLVLGKYLSPQLYLRYAIGFGQAVSTLQLQYQLTEHWVLRTESGESQAADILFTIEK